MAAVVLGVPRRRLYEIATVLRELHWVCADRKCVIKNVYWNNMNLEMYLGQTPQMPHKPLNCKVHGMLQKLVQTGSFRVETRIEYTVCLIVDAVGVASKQRRDGCTWMVLNQ